MATIRPYDIADKLACLRVFDSNIPDYFDISERDAFADFLDDPRGIYFTLEQDGEVVGCGGYAREDGGQARFTWGMVANNRHGDGLGRLLAEHRLNAIVDSHDFSEAELFTTPQVAPFFTKFGFVAGEIVKDGFAPGMDKVQMIKQI